MNTTYRIVGSCVFQLVKCPCTLKRINCKCEIGCKHYDFTQYDFPQACGHVRLSRFNVSTGLCVICKGPRAEMMLRKVKNFICCLCYSYADRRTLQRNGQTSATYYHPVLQSGITLKLSTALKTTFIKKKKSTGFLSPSHCQILAFSFI